MHDAMTGNTFLFPSQNAMNEKSKNENVFKLTTAIEIKRCVVEDFTTKHTNNIQTQYNDLLVSTYNSHYVYM